MKYEISEKEKGVRCLFLCYMPHVPYFIPFVVHRQRSCKEKQI